MEYEFYGAMRTAELVPGGASTPVTSHNRAEYVEAYTRWALTDSVQAQFRAFAHGFHQVWMAGCAMGMALVQHAHATLSTCARYKVLIVSACT